MKPIVMLSCALLSFPALAQAPDTQTRPLLAQSNATDAGTTNEPDTSPATAGAGGWSYGSEGSGDAKRTYATVPGQVDGKDPVTLTFSASNLSGRQARLQGLTNSPACAAGCRLQLSIDGAAQTVRATIPPNTDATLALRGARDIWRALEGAQRLEVTYPGAGGRAHKAIFEITGMDATALPKWK